VCGAAYIFSGVALDRIIPYIPAKLEIGLGKLYAARYGGIDDPRLFRIQQIADYLCRSSSEIESHYVVKIIDRNESNAFAIPGNRIILTSLLLNEINSENELAFILAHELGHFKNRDHMRVLGRSLIALALSHFLLGSDNGVTKFLEAYFVGINIKHSQRQEENADAFAVDLLYKSYGNVEGAMDFFEKALLRSSSNRLSTFFSTHPRTEDRIKALLGRAHPQAIPSIRT